MRCPWWLLVLFLAVAAKKKHRHQKPGRALLDRLSGTTESEVTVRSEARSEGDLLPAPLDVAPYATVTANATCGDTGAEEYCRDMPGKRGVVCEVCESVDGPPSRQHPASHAVDGDPSTWWQSPSLATGDYAHVELVATLPDKMELLHVIVKSGPSPRPLAWSLEVSSSESSEDWRMVRAFGDKDHCRKLWDLRPERRRRKARSAKRTNRSDKPTCSTQFASPKPLENGEMHVGVGEGVLARRVRVSFRAAHAAAASHQYYTVRALTLAARCVCHGHARLCRLDRRGAKCECEHDTCGNHCQRCCSGLRPCSSDGEGGCACGGRGACSYDDSGTLLCVNCTENRAGPLCDRCLSGFYNVLPDGPCLSCNCDPEGSDGSCKWDSRLHQIACSCSPGFTGPLCDSCADPTAEFPACQPTTTPACKCDPRGVVDPTRLCEDVCECKANVVGERCDTCAPGHFGLQASLAAGCTPCYCSRVTDTCVEAPGESPPGDIFLPMGEVWMVTDAMGNETLQPSIDDQGKPYIISYEVEGWELYYFVSHAWRGDQLEVYGRVLTARLHWALVRGDTGGSPTVAADLVLRARDGSKLVLANSSHEEAGPLTVSALLREDAWYQAEEPGTPVSRRQLLDVLRDLDAIMVRAHFHFDQDEVRLEGLEVGGAWQAAREVCSCPRGYGGRQCSRCGWGYAPLAAAPPACAPCPCHGHASCHTVDGPCGECQHNTTGPHCERCLPGHYGNPVTGGCQVCACPLLEASNNFSPNCALAAATGDDYVCTQCPDGYVGDHCESCDFGYWGSPTTPTGSCRECACGGAPCHPASGACLACPPHAGGARCRQCEEGYWASDNSSSPEGGVTCVACECGVGALASACDGAGRCACRPGWASPRCSQCVLGHGGVAAGCPACNCGLAAISPLCDTESGICQCAPGASPPTCDSCLPMHYGLHDGGCHDSSYSQTACSKHKSL